MARRSDTDKAIRNISRWFVAVRIRCDQGGRIQSGIIWVGARMAARPLGIELELLESAS